MSNEIETNPNRVPRNKPFHVTDNFTKEDREEYFRNEDQKVVNQLLNLNKLVNNE